MNQVCHCPPGLSDQWGCWNGDKAMGSGDNGEGPGPRPARVLVFCVSAVCSGLHRPGGSRPACGGGSLVCPDCRCFLAFPKRRGSCGTVRHSPHSCEAGTGLDAYRAFLGQGGVEGSKGSSQWLCAEVLT